MSFITIEKRGYSLIELMIVLTVLSIMAGISVPMLQKPLAKIHLKQTANEIVRQFKEIKLKAEQRGESRVFRPFIENVDIVYDDITCFPNGYVNRGKITVQQDKLSVIISVGGLTSSATIGEINVRW